MGKSLASGLDFRASGTGTAEADSFSLSAMRAAAGAALSANAACVAMPATMTHESSHEPQAITFAPDGPDFVCRAVLVLLAARQAPMKSPPIVFVSEGQPGRVVRAKNTMRMAKSWGHDGGAMPKHIGDRLPDRAEGGRGGIVQRVIFASLDDA